MRPRPARPRQNTISRALALVVAAAVLTAGCSGGQQDAVVTVTMDAAAPPPTGQQIVIPGLNDNPTTGNTSGAVPTADASRARFTLSPRTDSVDVPPNDPVTATVFAATLDEVQLVAADGSQVEGQINETASTWTATQRLDYDTAYTFQGSATAKETGEILPITGTFTTVKPENLMGVQLNIPQGGTVGIAAPIIVTFSQPVTNRAAVERALTVTTSLGDQVEGSWGWVQDEDFQGMGVQSQVHWRPTKTPVVGDTPYWPAGTAVTVDLKLKGVPFGDGYWGKADLTSSFNVRPEAQLVIADVSSFRLVVTIDGQVTKNYPVSYGLESVPGRATTNGIHVVTEKYPEFSMCNEAFGYCNSLQKWAVRINNNGEFIHENMANAANLGVRNSSHGCVNMGDPDAKEYYDSAMYGDPVVISNANGPQMSEQDALYNWIYTPEEWKQLSALT